MRLVGLVSGGKDSIYNLLQCIAAGHEIVCLANICPAPDDNDELDSFMFQTVGHEGVTSIAEAVGLPLFRHYTKGKAKCSNLVYETTPEDEVEDLYRLLETVQKATKCDGVASGAIASDYQRLRVEAVCARLGLTNFSYLWHLDQNELLSRMIAADINAILVKVASLGLEPQKHLGKSIREIQDLVTKLNEKYGVNVCGEGGEYETLVLDCPLFHSKIVIDESKIVSDATSGYLKINSCHLEPKFAADLKPEDTWLKRLEHIRQIIPGPDSYITDCLREVIMADESRHSRHFDYVGSFDSEYIQLKNIDNRGDVAWTSMIANSGWYFIGNVMAPDVATAIAVVRAKLSLKGLLLENVVYANLWLKDMSKFAAVNKEFEDEMEGVAPARACVAVPLPSETPILLEVVANASIPERCHVESISHWAPASIGPYSQSGKVGNIVFLAGQIPMLPGTMAVIRGSVPLQIGLTLRHCDGILSVSKLSLRNTLLASVYVTSAEKLVPAVEIVRHLLEDANPEVFGVVVTTLPRCAEAEIQLVADMTKHYRWTEKNSISLPSLLMEITTTSSENAVSLTAHITSNGDSVLIKEDLRDCISLCLKAVRLNSRAGSLRLFYRYDVADLRSMLVDILGGYDYCSSLVPVVQCEANETILTVAGVSFVNN